MNDALWWRKFERADFIEYRRWYEDAQLNRQLGPLDEEWLEYVLHETDGVQLCFLRADELIAVAGIKFPDEDHPFYVITDLAVKPSLRGQGIGTETLSRLLQASEFNQSLCWRAFVMPDNLSARAFFLRCGWRCIALPSEQDEMYIFETMRGI